MIQAVWWSLLISFIINFAMFLVAFGRKSDKLTDASYAVSFIVLALFAYWQSQKTAYDLAGLLLVTIWAVRIGSFLLYRVLRTGKDQRFDAIRNSFWQFGKFWFGQAITVWVLMIPATLVLTGHNSWGLLAWIGIGIWLVGFCIESIADLQKYRFTQNKAHKNEWIDTGIWRYSRHPNYFGEIFVWVGIYVFAFSNLSLTEQLVGFISPLFITVLLLFVSGIPILEKNADKRWGNLASYQLYKKRTSVLIPFFKRSE